MRSLQALGLAAVLFGAAGGDACADGTVRFPALGTPYAAARVLLLKQGLEIAPDPFPQSHDRQFHELDCDWDDGKHCRALFLLRRANGWRDYVVVEIDARSRAVTRADYPFDAEALASIPPPLAGDVPQLKGSYLRARRQLARLGFKPAHRRRAPAEMCVDEDCKRMVLVPEAQCSGTGLSYCDAYWISRNGRVLCVTTIGEDDPAIFFVAWTTKEELREFERE
jgi:hypothetical protein